VRCNKPLQHSCSNCSTTCCDCEFCLQPARLCMLRRKNVLSQILMQCAELLLWL
jgi:hypothetical protein